MSNNFHKEKEKDPLDFKEVFRISNADIKKTGVTQCKVHKWRKLTETDLECVNCPTVVKVNNIKQHLCQTQ